ncbi:hypothetical protein KSP39_PZI002699 [Platanthera zijinensis]|uniref:S-adenosyl-L-methionine-dependent methyltransferase n=1 Tax=Platanthera zijinensis TaxID=2320716 RepID=A0AAP0BYI4_9ASPA
MIGLTQLRRPPAIRRLVRPASHFPLPASFISDTKMRRAAGVDARLAGAGSDSNLHAAIRAASLRFEETLRPDPLFIDPYAECLVFPGEGNFGIKEQQQASLSSTLYYRLATKFIDDKILNEVNSFDELRQVVLLTDGMDTRPYRLNWPRYTVIYDISPEAIFKEAHKKLQDSGAKLSKTCMIVHTSMELSDLHMLLSRKGFSGYKPSLWVLQGLPLTTLAEFENILSTVSSFAMKGCPFIGEFPGLLLGDKFEDKASSPMHSAWLR